MGADLFIRKISNARKAEWAPKFDAAVEQRNKLTRGTPEYDAAQKLVDEAHDGMYNHDGYFRDSYNGTSVLSRLGLSWWRDMEYDLEMSEDDSQPNNVSSAACQRFLDKVLAAGEIKPATLEELKARHCTVDDGENSVEGWNKYFTEKRERLIAFLKRAVEHGGMYASC